MTNKNLEDKLTSLEDMISTQRNCMSEGDPSASYMHGLLNGLILAYSVVTGDSPKFHSMTSRNTKKKIRHKSFRKI